jgi:hypothetical protein
MALAGYWHDVYIGGVRILLVDHGPTLLWRRQLRHHRPLSSGGLAEPVARQRHGLQLGYRQSRQDHWSPRARIDRRLVQLCQPKGDARGSLPGLLFLAFLYSQAGLMFIILGFETEGRSIEEIDRSLKAPAVGGLGSVEAAKA